MIISFISPIQNEENLLNFLFKRIDKYYDKYDFEWIFIDDHSTDKSLELLQNYAQNKDKIKVVKNPGKGKIDAINYGFNTTTAKYIKLIAGDDEVDLSFIDELKKNNDSGISFVHDGKIIDEKNNILGNYVPPYQLFKYDLDKYLLNNISCPSWCWIFPREQAKLFFPIPECKYEDLYLSFCIKKFTKINYIKKDFYTFKQNEGQTFGNILKFNREIGDYRSRRSLRSLSIMKNSDVFDLREKFLISKSRLYFIYFLKKKNLYQIFMSELPLQRKFKLLIFRYFFFIYSFIQQFKYKFDDYYHFLFKKKIYKKKDEDNNVDINLTNLAQTDKNLFFTKSCVNYPSTDGLTIQYLNFLNHMCSIYEHKGFIFCKKNFDQDKFFNDYPNIKNVKLIFDYPNTFAKMTLYLLYSTFLHKIGLKKNKFFNELEVKSKENDSIFYFHDLAFYPLLFLKLKKEQIILSITDLQTNRLFKLIFVSKKIIIKFYYFIGFFHCLFIESFLFKKIRKLHVYSPEDDYFLRKFFLYKNSVSIPNYSLVDRLKINDTKLIKFKNNENKILIMGDLNQPELMSGLIKLSKMKYFSVYQKRYIFVFKGNYSVPVKENVKKILTNCEFLDTWIENNYYLNFLDSYKILLFLDRIDFGLSNRVLDALKAKSLIVGFHEAFTGYQLKNFKEVIFMKNFFDLVYAYNLDTNNKNSIIEKANNKAKKFGKDLVITNWQSII